MDEKIKEKLGDNIEKIKEYEDKKIKQEKKVAKKIIREYVKENNLLIFGEKAYRILLKDAGCQKEEMPQLEEENNYLRCFVSKGMKNIGELIKKMKENKVENPRTESYTKRNSVMCYFKVLPQNKRVLELSNIHQNIIDMFLKIKSKKNYTIINVNMCRMILFNILSDVKNVEMWKNSKKYLELLEKYYAINTIYGGKILNAPIKNKNIEFETEELFKIFNLFIENNAIFTEEIAYILYIKYSGINVGFFPLINKISVYITEKNLEKIKEKIAKNKKLSEIVEYSFYNGILDIIGKKIVIKRKDIKNLNILANVYIIEHETVNEIQREGVKFVNYFKLMKDLLILWWLSMKGEKEKLKLRATNMINKLTEAKQKYYTQNKKEIDGKDNLFRVFDISELENALELEDEMIEAKKKLMLYLKKHGKEMYQQAKKTCKKIEI